MKIDVETPAVSSGTTPVASLHYAEDAALDQPSAAQRAKFRRFGRMHFLACCWCFFLEGWNDGTTGPLLPVIQKHYNVGFAVVSLIFVLNCIGFVIGAFLNVHLNDKFGFGKVSFTGSVCQLATYAILAPAGPFPLMIIAYGLAGFGMALQNACANGFVGSLNKGTATKLGFLHGSYGLGAFVAPLAATHFAQMRHWSFHFLISLGLAVSNTVVLSAVFKFRTQDEIMAEAGHAPGELSKVSESKYRQIMGIKVVHYLALFALIYIGVEVTLGGWIVTFIIQERQGGANAGYISSGFFGGITVGRIGLIWLNRWIGERNALFLYALIAIGLEVTVWVVPSLIENAVAVSVIGVLMGPMYPILVNHTKSILPGWLLTGSVGWITGIGQAGSAVLPFVAGVLASKFGISSMQPLVVSMMGAMTVVWILVSRVQRRID
ncbi:MFS general substrate transporter [Dentipellis sp. KUC8613]|nr:MFS general substrate transporter [Dentipellis sp. KUC8613]